MIDIGIGNFHTITLENLLKGRGNYVVPYFQREFSWKKDDWNDLIEDIYNVLKHQKGYFFGFMTFKKPLNDEIQVIEGQQRLATITIIISVIRDILFKMGDDFWNKVEYEYVKPGDILSSETPPSYKLMLSDMNKDFFKKYILDVDAPEKKMSLYKNERKVNLSNQLIFKCYCFFYGQLESHIKSMTNDNKKDYLTNIIRTVLRNFVVITTEVSDSHTAYSIFQTINDRGLDLNLTDILKTYLFEQAGDVWGDAKSKWDEIRETLSQINVNSFLRHYWLSTQEVIREKDLLRAIESKIKTKTDVFNFLDKLRSEADVYEALLNPRKDYWNDKEIIELIDELQTLTTQMVMPLLMAASQLNNKEFIKILRTCISFIFRYLTIAESENKVLERMFSDIAIDIRKGKIKNAKEVIKCLSKEYIDNETFYKLFCNKEIKSSKVAKYILRKIDDFLNSDKEKFSDKITLEHILPVNPNEEWINYMKKHNIDKDEVVHKIGNLTLLMGKINKRAQNIFFTKKRDEYYSKMTKLAINEELKNIHSWTANDIKTRQEKLANYAVQIWKLD